MRESHTHAYVWMNGNKNTRNNKGSASRVEWQTADTRENKGEINKRKVGSNDGKEKGRGGNYATQRELKIGDKENNNASAYTQEHFLWLWTIVCF
jgi:hypothetical protein